MTVEQQQDEYHDRTFRRLGEVQNPDDPDEVVPIEVVRVDAGVLNNLPDLFYKESSGGEENVTK